ncbi:FixH family protein [Pseudogemmobacter sp. W21_MBD1_M6]|uniref:FixH family protein n=1 Tax=Pseudogemmobacter sp. W21_MBD1_M6 TaxID=3240271 RepID=UPI003F9E6961
MKPFTGRKVFAFTASAFAVIIGVNLTLAYQAVHTFPGLEVKNSYVASQEFNVRKSAQEALGWTVEADVTGGVLTVAFVDKDGARVEVADMTATLGRATEVKDDEFPDFVYRDRAFTAPVAATSGNWNLRLVATAPDGTLFQQRVILHLKG